MAEHKIELTLPKVELGKTDAYFNIFKDTEKLGEIRVSRGGIDYYRKNKKRGIRVSWTQFDEMMRKHSEE